MLRKIISNWLLINIFNAKLSHFEITHICIQNILNNGHKKDVKLEIILKSHSVK